MNQMQRSFLKIKTTTESSSVCLQTESFSHEKFKVVMPSDIMIHITVQQITQSEKDETDFTMQVSRTRMASVASLLIGVSRASSFTSFSRISTKSIAQNNVLPRSLATSSASTTTASDRLFPEELNIIYDSKCNVCKLEINFLRKRDQRVNSESPRLKFTDLEGETGPYNPSDRSNGGVSYAAGLASMHGVTADGKVIAGVPVFRKAYEDVGLGWLFAVTKMKGVTTVADMMYDVFAKYRTVLTRGQRVETLVAAYEEKKSLEAAKSAVDCGDACAPTKRS